jgi:hypothetical protein
MDWNQTKKKRTERKKKVKEKRKKKKKLGRSSTHLYKIITALNQHPKAPTAPKTQTARHIQYIRITALRRKVLADVRVPRLGERRRQLDGAAGGDGGDRLGGAA